MGHCWWLKIKKFRCHSVYQNREFYSSLLNTKDFALRHGWYYSLSQIHIFFVDSLNKLWAASRVVGNFRCNGPYTSSVEWLQWNLDQENTVENVVGKMTVNCLGFNVLGENSLRSSKWHGYFVWFSTTIVLLRRGHLTNINLVCTTIFPFKAV